MNVTSNLAAVIILVIVGLGASGLLVWFGYWIQRLAVRHGMRDHYLWVEQDRAAQAAYERARHAGE